MNNITNQDREIFKQIKAQFPNSYYRKPEVIAIFEKLTEIDTLVNKIRFMTLDLKHIPVCKTRGKELLNYNNSFCNNFCAAKNNELSLKKKQTCIEKYGVDNPAKSEIVRSKIKDTNLEKYGVDNMFKSTDFITKNLKNKRINTLMRLNGLITK